MLQESRVHIKGSENKEDDESRGTWELLETLTKNMETNGGKKKKCVRLILSSF